MLYREMFDEVHAPQGLKEDVLNMTKQDTARVARKISAAFVIAAVLAVVLADTWKQFPYISLMIFAGLQTIPKDVYEAAQIDGAGRVATFWRITLPNLKQILLIVLLFRTMGAIRIFDIIFGITGGGPANATATLLFQAYKYLFGDMNFGLGSALSTIITILILICSFVYIKVLKTDD